MTDPDQTGSLPSPSRRDAVRNFKRSLIRDAAKQIFTERGIDAASMREIAQTAGYTTGSIYTYFATKEDLYAEILRDSMEAQQAAIREASESAPPGPGSRTRGVLLRLWQFYQENPADFDLGFYLYGGARPAGLNRDLDGELNTRLDQLMTTIADSLVADGLVPQEHAHHWATVHATSIFGLLLMTKTARLRSVNEKPGPMLESYLRIATQAHLDEVQ